MPAPALLPQHEFHHIVHDKAHGLLSQAAQGQVFLGPGHHAFGRVHVDYLRPRRRQGAGGAPGIGEQVQGPEGLGRLFHQAPHPVPIDRLLREQARVLKACGPHLEGQVPVLDGPAFGQGLGVLPVAASGGGADIAGVHGPGLLHGPYRLGIRPQQPNLAPAFQLIAVARVQDLIILPSVRQIHMHSPYRCEK